MKNIPEKIYLQIGNECDSEDFNELSEVSWCKDKIYENDIEFIQNKVSDADTKIEEDLIYRIVENWGNAVHPISEMVDWLQEYAISETYDALDEYKAINASVNEKKVSDVSAEEVKNNVARRYNKKANVPYLNWHEMETILGEGSRNDRVNLFARWDEAMQEYASIVNKEDNIPADFKQVTGHDSPKEMAAYEKGREDEQKVCIDWIEKWNGNTNSVMGALLNKKFDERKDNVGVWVKVEFKEMDRMVLTRKSGDTFTAMNNSRNEGLFDFFSGKDKPESQPQQEEESEKELEERTDRNMNVISDFCEHVKNEVGLVIPESAILSFFNA